MAETEETASNQGDSKIFLFNRLRLTVGEKSVDYSVESIDGRTQQAVQELSCLYIDLTKWMNVCVSLLLHFCLRNAFGEAS